MLKKLLARTVFPLTILQKKYTKTHEYIGDGTINVTKTHPMPVPGVPGNRKRKKGPETSISSISYSRLIAFFFIDPGV
jgi:hypothetical protein